MKSGALPLPVDVSKGWKVVKKEKTKKEYTNENELDKEDAEEKKNWKKPSVDGGEHEQWERNHWKDGIHNSDPLL